MRKLSKSAQIRNLLKLGNTPKKVAELLTVDVKRVYNENWKLKNFKKRKPIGRPPKTQVTPTAPALPTLLDALKAELATVEKQMDNLSVIASFLAIRIRQMEQR